MPLSDIKGQPMAVEILKSAVKSGKIAHAYIFLGPAGTGKSKAAIEFSKLLNCVEAKDDACGVCPSCAKIEKMAHPDVIFIETQGDAKEILIDSIRGLQHRFYLKPFEARYKIAIINRSEDMNEEASNCLLKILEEPPADTIFILTAAHQWALPQTVASRCQIIRFKPLSRNELKGILVNEFAMPQPQAAAISAISGANLELALSFRDKEFLNYKNSIVDEFIQRRLRPQENSAKKDSRQELIGAMDILLGFYRDILVYKFTEDPDIIFNVDRLESIKEMSGALKTGEIRSCIEEIEKTKVSLQANANCKLAIAVLNEKLSP